MRMKFARISFNDEFIEYLPLMDFITIHMVLVQKRKEVLCHNALVTTHVCFIMVFVPHIDMTFSWMVSTPF